MKAKSIKGKSIEIIKEELENSMADGFRPTLAIVFISVKQNREVVCHLLNQKDIQIFGVTTAGEFIDGDIEKESIAMMLLDMNPAYFKIAFVETSKQVAFDDAKKLGVTGKKIFTNPAFIICTGGIDLGGEQVVEGITQSGGTINGEVTLFGAKAGDDLALEATYVFTNNKNSANALLALIVNEDKIDVRGIATCGWNAIGTTKTVTKSEDNIIYTIDDKPALDMLMSFLGVDIKQEGDKEIVTFLSSWYYPLQMERENAEPVIRTAMFANKENRSLICSGNVPLGSKIKFALPPDFDSMDKVVADCKTIKNNEHQQADALIMFSCVSRYLSFGIAMREEIDGVQNIWNAPMVGFFTYGEFGKSKTGRNEYHNNACCLVTLKEM
ncbi:MAG TPA: FIST N-terminal domain-containing protein [Ferruginibacter sp.]|nr:FIST N-terminal domain-containing protein [Ferruginibacter sp.]